MPPANRRYVPPLFMPEAAQRCTDARLAKRCLGARDYHARRYNERRMREGPPSPRLTLHPGFLVSGYAVRLDSRERLCRRVGAVLAAKGNDRGSSANIDLGRPSREVTNTPMTAVPLERVSADVVLWKELPRRGDQHAAVIARSASSRRTPAAFSMCSMTSPRITMS